MRGLAHNASSGASVNGQTVREEHERKNIMKGKYSIGRG